MTIIATSQLEVIVPLNSLEFVMHPRCGTTGATPYSERIDIDKPPST